MTTFVFFLHVLFAAIWVGGNVALQIIGTRISKSGDPGRMPAMAFGVMLGPGRTSGRGRWLCFSAAATPSPVSISRVQSMSRCRRTIPCPSCR